MTRAITLKSQIGKGSDIVCSSFYVNSRQYLSTRLFTFSIIIHSIHLYGITPFSRQDSSLIADGVSQSRSVVRGVRVSSHEAVGLINTANSEDETLLSYNVYQEETHDHYTALRPRRAASTLRCHDNLDLHHLIAFGAPFHLIT